MSSSSSATGLNRSRSLRQPTAGLGKAQRKDGEKEVLPAMAGKALETKPKGPVTSASASISDGPRTMSPSRLPKPGASSIATRARAGTVGITTSAPGTRTRPNSGVFSLGRSKTVAARKPTQSPAGEEAEPPKATRPTSSTTINTKLTKPKSITSAAKVSPSASYRSSTANVTKATSVSTTKTESPVTVKHSRTKLAATSLTPATSLRPPRPPSAGSMVSASTATTTATATSKRPVGRTNPVPTRASHQRQPSASSSAITSTLSGTSSTTNTTTRAPKQNPAEDPPRLRPAFNTLQQHYSPARNVAPKPLTSTYFAPPTPSKLPANVALSSDTAKLQTELLQLHLLHRNADTVAASWHASARERLGRRFAELAQEDLEVGKEEVVVEEGRNLAALIAWGGARGGEGLEDKIQILDSVLSGLWSLGEAGAGYARVVRKFEKWVDQTMAAVDARRTADGVGALMEGDEIAFVGELDLAWKDEVSSIARKLDGWRRQLKQVEVGLPEEEVEVAQHRFSLVRILAGCRSQVYDMLAELNIMEQIERDAIAQEAGWIRRMNREAEADDTPRAGAIWRAF